MKPPPGDDRLLTTPLARDLYHGMVRDLPCIDYHCHLNPAQLAADHRFADLTELWIANDPYKHRLMRIAGVPEREITGPATNRAKLDRWAATLPLAAGNPLHAWSTFELVRALDIHTPLSPTSADDVWHAAGSILANSADHTARGLLARANVACVCTSDRLLDDLSAHTALAGDPSAVTLVLPSLRADDIVAVDAPGFEDWIDHLGRETGTRITGLDGLRAAISVRLDAFDALGCRLADHSFEQPDYTPVPGDGLPALFARRLAGAPWDAHDSARLRSGLLMYLCDEYARRGWILQLHLGAKRATSSRLASLAGPAGGYAAMGNPIDISRLCALLDDLERLPHGPPRTILYPLNPADTVPFAVLTGSFTGPTEGSDRPGHLQLGPAWWFNDHRDGIRAHLEAVSAHGLLGAFIGMNTDARSPLSQVRHDYFRRVLCDWLAGRAAAGIVPDRVDELAPLLRAVCHDNAARALGLPPLFP